MPCLYVCYLSTDLSVLLVLRILRWVINLGISANLLRSSSHIFYLRRCVFPCVHSHLRTDFVCHHTASKIHFEFIDQFKGFSCPEKHEIYQQFNLVFKWSWSGLRSQSHNRQINILGTINIQSKFHGNLAVSLQNFIPKLWWVGNLVVMSKLEKSLGNH